MNFYNKNRSCYKITRNAARYAKFNVKQLIISSRTALFNVIKRFLQLTNLLLILILNSYDGNAYSEPKTV